MSRVRLKVAALCACAGLLLPGFDRATPLHSSGGDIMDPEQYAKWVSGLCVLLIFGWLCGLRAWLLSG